MAVKVNKNSFNNGLPGIFCSLGKWADIPDELAKRLEGKHDLHVPTKPATTPALTKEQKDKIAFYDKLNTHFGGDATNDKVPTDLTTKITDWKKWPAKFPDPADKTKTLTPEQVYTKYSEGKKPADYDTIKTERDDWIAAFPKKDFKDKKITPTDIKTSYDDGVKWIVAFPNADFKDKKITPANVRTKYDEPKGTGITPEQQKKIDNYDTIKTEKDKLKSQLTAKQAEIDRLKSGGNQQVKKDSLADDINRKIMDAYNSPSHLIGYNIKLMKTFLSWEFTQDERKRQAVIKLKSDINKCLTYLENKRGS